MKKILNIPTFTRVTAPTDRFITLAQAKQHLKVDTSTAENTLIEALINTAHELAENYTRQLLGAQTWKLTIDELCGHYIFIDKYPVISIDSIVYVDSSGIDQTVPTTDYQVDLLSNQTRIYFLNIPILFQYFILNAITVNFTAGLIECPSILKSAMLLMIGHLYENRQDVVTGTQVAEIPMTSRYLMDKIKIY